MNDIATFAIDRGVRARDQVTGFEGIVIARLDRLAAGRNEYLLQPQVDGGVFRDARWFYEDLLEVVNSSPVSLGVHARWLAS